MTLAGTSSTALLRSDYSAARLRLFARPKQPVDTTARKAFKSISTLYDYAPERRIPAKTIMRIVAGAHRVSVDQMLAHTRLWHVCRARQHAMAMIRRLRPDLSYPRIGQAMGGRDHCTVILGIRQWNLDEAAFPEQVAIVEADLAFAASKVT